LLVASTGVTAINSAPAAPSAASRAIISFHVHLQLVSPTTGVGAFEVSGAVNDQGQATHTFSLRVDPFAHPHHAVPLTGVGVYVGAHGTITISFRGRFDALEGGSSSNGHGRWRIVSATGDDAGLTGGGYWASSVTGFVPQPTVPPQADATFVGTVAGA